MALLSMFSKTVLKNNFQKQEPNRSLLSNTSIPSEIFYRREIVHFHELCQLRAKFLHKAITMHHNTSAYLLSEGQRQFIFSNKNINDVQYKWIFKRRTFFFDNQYIVIVISKYISYPGEKEKGK